MKIYTYILAHDTGFSPNPFHRWLTLACCKPAIRRTAKPGDWVVGITPHALGNRLAYAMQIAERLTFAQYWADPRFRAKRPRHSSRDPIVRRGDNCYKPLVGEEFVQIPCSHPPQEQEKDLSGRYVLVARRFCYYGANARRVPPSLRFMVPKRGHRSRFTPGEMAQLLPRLQKLPRGRHGKPRLWPDADCIAQPNRRLRCD
jgi:hypothetical protein